MEVNSPLVIHLLLRGDRVDPDDEYLREMRQRNMTALTIPILNFKFVNRDALKEALLSIINRENSSDGLLLTSPRAVESLEGALSEMNPDERTQIIQRLNPNLVFVVGKRTGYELQTRLTINANLESYETGSFEALSELVKSRYMNYKTESDEHVNLVYPHASVATSTGGLAGLKHLNLVSCSAYETSAKDDIYIDILDALDKYKMTMPSKESVCNKVVINLVFFSPSGLKAINRIPRENLELAIKIKFSGCDVRFVNSSIGKTTEKALLSSGITPVCVAEKPTPVALADTIAAFLDSEFSH